MPRSNKKADNLKHWGSLPAGQDPLPHMTPIPYKAQGSRYGACGIRIDGTPAFIDAVLSNLKTLIDGENNLTRLDLARTVVDGSKLGKAFHNAAEEAEVCYVRLHERGQEGKHASIFFDKHLHEATARHVAGMRAKKVR
jgi:hypothetical protein